MLVARLEGMRWTYSNHKRQRLSREKKILENEAETTTLPGVVINTMFHSIIFKIQMIPTENWLNKHLDWKSACIITTRKDENQTNHLNKIHITGSKKLNKEGLKEIE